MIGVDSIILILSDILFWFFSVITAATGAFLAYVLWSWVHSPHLVVSDIERIPVIDPNHPESEDQRQYSTRIEIKNIGTKSAINCEGTLKLQAETEKGEIRSQVNAPWLPKKADLIVSDESQMYLKTIPAGRTEKLEIIRQYRKGKVKLNAVGGGNKFVHIDSNSDIAAPGGDLSSVAFRETSKHDRESAVQTMSSIDPDLVFDSCDWESSELNLTVETESALPLVVDLTVELDEDGRFSIEKVPHGRRKRISNKIYNVLNRVRTGNNSES